MPRPKSKRLLKAQEQFKAAITAYLESIGARPGTFYDLELDTPAGLLHVRVYDDWVATRFDDVKRATPITKACGYACNHCSGKWNFCFYNGTIESLDPRTVILSLSFYLYKLLNWEAAAA